jgi:hypothetical protein
MKPEDLLYYLQEAVTHPYPEPDESTPHSYFLFTEDQHAGILPRMWCAVFRSSDCYVLRTARKVHVCYIHRPSRHQFFGGDLFKHTHFETVVQYSPFLLASAVLEYNCVFS